MSRDVPIHHASPIIGGSVAGLLCVMLLNPIVVNAQQNPVVQTSTFAVMGTTYPVNSSAVPNSNIYPTNVTMTEIFYGVPFGESTAPPYRFQKPVPKMPYSSVRNCTTWFNNPGCHLPLNYPAVFPFSEDCLNMNIHRPAGTQAGANLPVLVWIYGQPSGGGGFAIGINWLEAPPWNFMFPNFYVSQGMVVVQIQFRTNFLGFGVDSWGGAGELKGSYGFFDQQLALKWVYNNVVYFGGSNQRITLYGEYTGSCCVAIHSIHPNSTAYFQQAIQSQGALAAPWCVPQQFYNIPFSRFLIDQLNCTNAPQGVAACLNAYQVEAILNVSGPWYATGPPNVTGDFDTSGWGAVYDADFFPTPDPSAWIRAAPPKPTLMAVSSDTAIWNTRRGQGSNWTITNPPAYNAANFSDFIHNIAIYPSAYSQGPIDFSNALAVSQLRPLQDAIANFYISVNNQVNASILDAFYFRQYTRLQTDICYIVPAWWEARLKTQLGWPVYSVYMDWGSPNQNSTGRALFPYKQPSATSGLPWVLDFDFDVGDWPLSTDDFTVRATALGSWISFIKTGAPSPTWPRLQHNSSQQCSNTGNYTALSLRPVPYVQTASNSDVGTRLAFWDALAQQYDFRLVHSFPHILGECLPCALRTQLITPNSNSAPLIVGLNASFATPPLSPTGRLSFTTRFSAIKTMVANNSTTPAAQINSIINTYVAWAIAGTNNSLTSDVAVMNNTQIGGWGTMKQFVNCGFM